MKNGTGDLCDIGTNIIVIMVKAATEGKSFAEKIGADDYGADAAQAVSLAGELVKTTTALIERRKKFMGCIEINFENF